jgi:hypothetical protein
MLAWLVLSWAVEDEGGEAVVDGDGEADGDGW